MEEHSTVSTDENEDLSDSQIDERKKIRDELSSMSLEEMLRLKEELGAKVYKESILGVQKIQQRTVTQKDLKRTNKNRPREETAKRQVPFLGAELRSVKKVENNTRDPRFDERAGDYDVKTFKTNYKFVSDIRNTEIAELKKRLQSISDVQERAEIKESIKRLRNKNIEDSKWHSKQQALKEEKKEIQQSRTEGKQPHYLTKKERRAKELVAKFEELKKTGRLAKHMEKRRKKNVAKDRKKMM